MGTRTTLLLISSSIAFSGAAQFTEHPIERCDSHEPSCVRAGDLDLDGDIDLVAMSTKDGRLIWYANEGNGSFGLATSIHQLDPGAGDSRFMPFELADMDGDLDLDVVAFWDGGWPPLSLHRNQGDGTFTPPEMIGGAEVFYTDFYSIVLADIDGNGALDVLVGDDASLKLFINDGSGSFTWQTLSDSGGNCVSLRAGDVDNDGDQDILYAQQVNCFLRRNDGTGSLTSQVFLNNGLGGTRAQVHWDDLNGDGFLDIVYIALDALRWKPNDGQGGFAWGQGTIIGPQDYGPAHLNTADLDGDGDPDILLCDYATDEIRWYANDGAGGFSDPQIITNACPGVYSFDTSDLDGDGDLDIVAAATSGAFVGWLANAGNGTFGPLTVLDNALNTPISLAQGDLDSDGDPDLAVASSYDGKLAWYPTLVPGALGPQLTITSGVSQGNVATLSDLDGDGDLDMLAAWTDQDQWADPSYVGLAWYANDGSGGFGQMQPLLDQEPFIRDLETADLDGDGDVDVIGCWQDHIIPAMNDGTGNFTPDDTIHIDGFTFQGHSVGDLDGDGDTDIIAIMGDVINSATVLHWFVNVDGVFDQELVIDDNDLDIAFQTRIADVDGDGDRDILVIREILSQVQDVLNLYINDGSGAFNPALEQLATEEVEQLLLADIDGDGDVDEVVADRAYDFGGYTGRLVWKANDGSGTFGPDQTIADSSGIIATLGAFDMDADGLLDIVAGGPNSGWLSWFKNPGITTSLSGPSQSATLRIAPNPCAARTRLFSDVPLTPQHAIAIIDARGSTLATLAGTGGREMVVPCAAFAPGLYAVRVALRGTILGSTRLVVE